MNEKPKQELDRRAFFGAGAAAGLMILDSRLVRGSQANSAVRVGLLGCGGRGTADATSIAMSGPARIVALADLFEDRLLTAKTHFDEVANKQGHAGVDKSQMFKGPRASEQIFASSEVDAVVIATPPYFHPQHLAAAVQAGKHVYCEKPVAIDVPGIKHALEVAKKAEDRVSVDVGFQIRKAPPFVELVRRIHAGAIGEIACGEAHYYCPFLAMPEYPNASPTEFRLRHWLHDRVLSGDIIVEQNIHVIDICNWVLKRHPYKAIGTGGRKGRTEQGNAYSHFNVIFYYPENVEVSFSSTQFGKGAFDVERALFRNSRQFEFALRGPRTNHRRRAWTWEGDGQAQRKKGDFSVTGTFSDNLAQADSEKHADFIQSITSRKFHNQIGMGAESALTAMLGRTAAYTGKETTWAEMMESNEVWDAGIDINKLGMNLMKSTVLAIFAVLLTAATAHHRSPPRLRVSPDLYATINTTQGAIVVKFFEKEAPVTVRNFTSLARGLKSWTGPQNGPAVKRPLYTGTIFHRVIPNFMIQGGDPLGTGIGGPGFTIPDEFSPDLKFDVPGRLAMANVGRPHTGGSQFFITEEPTPHLNGLHTIFGQVVDGQDVVTKIAHVPRRWRETGHAGSHHQHRGQTRGPAPGARRREDYEEKVDSFYCATGAGLVCGGAAGAVLAGCAAGAGAGSIARRTMKTRYKPNANATNRHVSSRKRPSTVPA